MRVRSRLVGILCGAVLGLGVFVFAAVPRAAPDGDNLVAKAEAFLEAMEKGDFVLAAKDFDETMMKVSGPEKLAEFWKALPRELGSFEKRTAARRDTLGSYDIVLLTCQFAKKTLDIRVVFDKSGRITGFQLVPSRPPAEYEPPSYADPTTFEETAVTVGSDDWPLPGTLTMPKGSGPFPAVVLVHGSGPNDRNETIGPNEPFKDIAWGLASRGIAVLRYDKRSNVYRAKLIADPKLLASLTVKDETIDDALASARFLRRTPRINPARIFVLGHSLGGYLMPRIALAGKSLDLAGFIIMAGLTRPLDTTMLRQMKYLYGLAGRPLTEQERDRLAGIEADIEKIKSLKASDKESTTMIMGGGAAYWLDLRGYDPPKTAESVPQPMLILQGERDYQVTTDDFENWKRALGSRANVEFHLCPKLNHLFFEGQGLPTPDEYLQVHGNVAPYVIEDISRWILCH